MAPPKLFNPFSNRMYDIRGEEKKVFVERLSKLIKLAIIEEDDVHIRILYAENNDCYSLDELQKFYDDYIALCNSMSEKIEITYIHIPEN